MAVSLAFDSTRSKMSQLDEAPDQLVRENQYRDQYLRWVASLTPKDRAALQKQGLDRPKIESTAQAYLRPEVFRESTATLGLFQEDHAAESWQHPADLLEPEEEDIDGDDIARLGAYDPELLRTLIRVLFMGGRKLNPKTIVSKFVALCHSLHVEGIGDRSLESLAEEIGCTRSLLSNYVVGFRDFAGLDHRGGWSAAARDTLRNARRVPVSPKQRAQAIAAGIPTRPRGTIRRNGGGASQSDHAATSEPAEAGT
jgi:hypothetical protein